MYWYVQKYGSNAPNVKEYFLGITMEQENGDVVISERRSGLQVQLVIIQVLVFIVVVLQKKSEILIYEYYIIYNVRYRIGVSDYYNEGATEFYPMQKVSE